MAVILSKRAAVASCNANSMTNMQKYGAAFLLFIIFSIKIITPLFANLYAAEKTETEQQEEKTAEEKAGQKTSTYEIEVTDLLNIHQAILSVPAKESLHASFQHFFLPVQYFAIPTPPPWCKS